MIPPARDPRMDRGAEDCPPLPAHRLSLGALDAEAGPTVSSRVARRVVSRASGTSSQTPWAGWGTGLAAVVALLCLAAVTPRVLAYSDLAAENAALRTRLQHVDARMDDVERMMARLRLYDAQLRSLTEAEGSHGGLADDQLAGVGLADDPDALDVGDTDAPEAGDDGVAEAPEPPLEGDGEPMDALDDANAPDLGGDEAMVAEAAEVAVPGLTSMALRPAAGWAEAVQARVDAFLDVFEVGEVDLNALMADLETLRAIRGALPQRWPAKGVLTSKFGWRSDPVHGTTRFHAGTDIANDRGTPIRAVAPGVVLESGYTSGYGRVVVLDHGFGISTRYAHCTTLRVRVGDRVEEGDFIATMGSTGKSTGTHLHFELRIDGSAHDPMKYLPR